MKGLLIILSLLISLSTVNASVDIKQFANEQQEKRYKHIIQELRCLVCQNQNIAGSNAGLAQDLRKKVHQMILAGNDDEAIYEFMVSRYGDFVLYRPPFNLSTLLLWLGPFIIFAIGLFVLMRFIRNRKKVVVTELSNEEKEKLKKLLKENKESNK
jgi:cytochrome c-type biogenesis protein CcmH